MAVVTHKAMLLVGGPRDGDWHQIPDDMSSIVVLVPSKCDVVPYDQVDLNKADFTIMQTRYRRESIRGERKNYEFFAHDDLERDKALELLLRYYGRILPRDQLETERKRL